MISQKIDNAKYAPGVATYGIDGKTGDTGMPGCSLFYTSFNLMNDNTSTQLSSLRDKIKNNEYPIQSATADKIPRPYINGDCFFDRDGNIFRLIDIDTLKSLDNSGNGSSYSKYFKLVGKINTETGESYLHQSANTHRAIINTEYKGLDINAADAQSYLIGTDSAFAIRIISDQLDEGSIIPFISNVGLYGQDSDIRLDLCYDITIGAFVLKSKKPIVLDAEVTVFNKTTTDSFGDYSRIMTNETPITAFYNLCKHITYSVTMDTESDMGKLQHLDFDLTTVNENVMYSDLFEKIKDFITVKIEYVDEDTDETSFINGLKTETFLCKIDDILSLPADIANETYENNIFYKFYKHAHNESDISIKHVSLIYNIEVYLKEKAS